MMPSNDRKSGDAYQKLTGSLMIQGTTSDAGKSICVAGLCRLLKRRGINVAPFKPQNMALNSAVTREGGEIGRAQALQAAACGLAPSTDFNPVLLKPSGDMRSQVIIHGKAVSQLEASRFGDIKSLAFEKVLESYQRLRAQYDVVLIEGAGSPAEINLRTNDIANMGFAEAVDCPVVLIGDINRGGVFAHLTGTLNLLSSSEQNRTQGFIINQFRGHLGLLQSGLDWLEDKTSKPVVGVIPYINALKLDAEDAIELEPQSSDARVKVKVLVLPRISNHTDFEPLKWHPDVSVDFVSSGKSLEGADLIIIPGSKSIRDDLAFVRKQKWDKSIQRHLRYGGKLLGICGGFQMLGQIIDDPSGIEGEIGTSIGLGFFDMATTLESEKQLTQVSGHCFLNGKKAEIEGYEIHCGQTKGTALSHPFASIKDQNNNVFNDGAVSADNQIVGTYVHGLFEDKECTQLVLNWVSNENMVAEDWKDVRERELDRLADAFEQSLDIAKVFQIIQQNSKKKGQI